MKSLRMSVLMLVLGASTASSIFAYGQQEVDPDHFDQPSAVRTQVHSPRAQNANRTSSVQRRVNTKLASARLRKARPHQHA